MHIAYCEWYDKALADVSESEQEKCLKVGLTCPGCLNLGEREDDDSIPAGMG